jgi:hypothetical protein
MREGDRKCLLVLFSLSYHINFAALQHLLIACANPIFLPLLGTERYASLKAPLYPCCSASASAITLIATRQHVYSPAQ